MPGKEGLQAAGGLRHGRIKRASWYGKSRNVPYLCARCDSTQLVRTLHWHAGHVSLPFYARRGHLSDWRRAGSGGLDRFAQSPVWTRIAAGLRSVATWEGGATCTGALAQVQESGLSASATQSVFKGGCSRRMKGAEACFSRRFSFP